jgi:hypothetical protein
MGLRRPQIVICRFSEGDAMIELLELQKEADFQPVEADLHC